VPDKWFRSVKHGSFQPDGPGCVQEKSSQNRENMKGGGMLTEVDAAGSLRIFNRAAQFFPSSAGTRDARQ
jgi:hypothetical protein